MSRRDAKTLIHDINDVFVKNVSQRHRAAKKGSNNQRINDCKYYVIVKKQ